MSRHAIRRERAEQLWLQLDALMATLAEEERFRPSHRALPAAVRRKLLFWTAQARSELAGTVTPAPEPSVYPAAIAAVTPPARRSNCRRLG